jgi:cobalt-zinc-cadmium efflux system protein
MSSNHAHAVNEGTNEKPLWIALILTTTFLIAEVVGGV